MKVRSIVLSLFLALPAVLRAQQVPPADSALVVAAAQLEAAIGDKVWPGWSAAPSQVLLVEDSAEFFFPSPADGAVKWKRPRVFPPTFLATFPAVGGVPTTVVGSPAATRTPGDRWVLTLLHEHFHQLQYTRPDYYDRVKALDLARGDTTGMWALNYPFPYDSAPIQRAVKRWADALHAALDATPGPADRVAQAVRAKASLDSLLAPDDRKYLNFQLWQEGVPRWIELAAAREGHRAGMIADSSLAWQEHRFLDDLTKVDLGQDHRVVVYALGAAMAELLDREGKGWRGGYFDRMFALPSPPIHRSAR